VTRLLWACLSRDILPAFRFPGDPPVEPKLAYALAADLGAAVVAKLAAHYPKHADRTRIRTKADVALNLIGQACAWTTDRLLEDVRADHPPDEDTLPHRVDRLLTKSPPLLNLPPGSRPAWLGVSYTLWVVVVNDRIRDCLREIFPGSQWSRRPDPRGRRKPSTPRPATERRGILGGLPCFKPFVFSAAVLDDAADQGIRGDATYVLTAAVVGLAKTTVPGVVRRARSLAAALDAADLRARRQ
jgi:hypothetical protein